MIDAGMLDQVTQAFMDAFKRDAHALQQIAQSLFYYLTVIQITLVALWSTFSAEPLNRALSKIAAFLFTTGFFYAGVTYGGDWITQVINGFIQVGQQSGIDTISPSAVLQSGLAISGKILSGFFNWHLLSHPFVATIGSIICVAVIVIYALLAAELVIVLVKSYVLVSLSSLFFALSSSTFTKPMFIQYFQTVNGIGLHLMTLYFLMAVGQTLGQDWATITAEAAKQHQLIPMFMIFATVIVYYMIVKNIPSFIAGLSGVGGFRNYGEETVAAAVGVGFKATDMLTKSRQASGQVIQAGAHGISNMQSMAASARQVSKQTTGFRDKVQQATGEFLKSGMSAAGQTVRDTVYKRDPHLSSGQKIAKNLNARMAQRKQRPPPKYF